jgi:metal-responsive CopG/Arc/MetJ family transcriptional regulator
MKPMKSKVSITLDDDIINEIKKLAENDDRSFSQYVNLILREYLSNQNEKWFFYLISR